MTENRLLLEVPEACYRLNVGRTTLYKLASEGRVHFVKVGRKTLVPAASLEAYVDSLTAATEVPQGVA